MGYGFITFCGTALLEGWHVEALLNPCRKGTTLFLIKQASANRENPLTPFCFAKIAQKSLRRNSTDNIYRDFRQT